jgi:hypothetical protein
MLDNSLPNDQKKPEIDHPLFTQDGSRWWFMFNGSSAYLEPEFIPDSWLKEDELHVQFNIKNYNSEIDNFLDWIAPWVSELIDAKYQYEEMDSPVPVNLSRKLEIDFSQNKTDYR